MIPGFPQVGGVELIIVLVVILLFFGAKRIPELARSLGKGANEFRKGISEGASKDEAQEEGRKDKEREDPPLRQAAEGKPSQAKTENVHTE